MKPEREFLGVSQIQDLLNFGELANRPKNIRIHLAVSRVRFHLLRFNSSGNFCDGGAICSRGTPYPNPHHKL